MAQPERRTGEFLTEAGIGVGPVALVRLDRVRAEQVRQELVVGDAGDLRGDDRAGLVVELVSGPVRVRGRKQVDLAVVLAQEQRVQCRQIGILLSPDVSRRVGAVDDRKVVSLRGEQATVGTAQRGGGRRVRAVDHRGVQPAGDVVDRGRGLSVDPGRRVDHRPGQRYRSAQRGIACGHGDVDVGDLVGEGQVDVMVDELSPGVHHPGEALGVGDLGVPIDHQVADGAGIGQVGAQ